MRNQFEYVLGNSERPGIVKAPEMLHPCPCDHWFKGLDGVPRGCAISRGFTGSRVMGSRGLHGAAQLRGASWGARVTGHGLMGASRDCTTSGGFMGRMGSWVTGSRGLHGDFTGLHGTSRAHGLTVHGAHGLTGLRTHLPGRTR